MRTSPGEEPSVSKLEQLPFDIRHQILLAVDTIADLSALVHASPTFHQQYLLSRGIWLRRCLQLELGHIFVDAYTVHLCNSVDFRLKRSRQQVREFIDAYHLRCSKATELLSSLSDTEEAIAIVAYYLSTIVPLVSHYVSWTQSNLKNLCVHEHLSQTENRRIIRGLYRFQLFCNYLGSGCGDSGSRLNQAERLGLFLGRYESWEIEEVLCINRFADAKYQRVFDAVQWDFHPDNPRFETERRDIHTPDGAFHLDNYAENQWYRNGINSLGLTVLSAIFNANDHSKLVETVSKNMVLLGEDWIVETSDSFTLRSRHEDWNSERERAQDDRQEMSFKGDRDDLPPLAWVSIWKGTCSNICGYCIPDSLREWGYVMWDSSRLIDSGAMAILDQQWRAMYGRDDDEETDDPRDDL
ncbi:hypothetical protein NW762_012590 [Fusarium torreyae]|uniref:F-box domain-containing protein n=1 Tax=Fusarium torreyae TaxID=1237075 RepID=A0A9W8RM86_9HYPO|nr:hypothetical protein NW762_012590 [Fusarium torreyae]